MYNYTVGFIGCGNIATAIFSGSVKSGYIKPDNFCVFDTDAAKTEAFVKLGAKCSLSPDDLVCSCDFIFLTIKPQVYKDVISSLNPIKTFDKCFIDVAAGITIDYVKSLLGYNAPVVRVMPNTPLMYGNGATAIVKKDPVTDEQFEFVKGFFDSCGITAIVNEECINTITAISGSAPAYVMRFIKNLVDFAEEKGVDRNSAIKLVCQTVLGSAIMVTSSNISVDTLIKNVTSPNGTTEAGLKSLDTSSYDEILQECLRATVDRAEELTL